MGSTPASASRWLWWIETQVKTGTQRWFGRSVRNCRLTLSSGHGAFASLTLLLVWFKAPSSRELELLKIRGRSTSRVEAELGHCEAPNRTASVRRGPCGPLACG